MSGKWKLAGMLAVLVGVLSFQGCTPDFLTGSQTATLLRVVKVEGVSGDEDETGDFLLSDVSEAEGGVFNDNAVVTVAALSKNPNLPDAGRFEDVLLERYEVRYVRSDGQSREGVDVPYSITGGLSTLVPSSGDSVGAAFVVVRHVAKLEPPLRELATERIILTCVAEITLHGRSASGEAVSVTGRLTIHFANYGD